MTETCHMMTVTGNKMTGGTTTAQGGTATGGMMTARVAGQQGDG